MGKICHVTVKVTNMVPKVSCLQFAKLTRGKYLNAN